VLKDFGLFAAKFEAKHDHPAVLVFDNVDVVASKNQNFCGASETGQVRH
jgi:hypothetical protein